MFINFRRPTLLYCGDNCLINPFEGLLSEELLLYLYVLRIVCKCIQTLQSYYSALCVPTVSRSAAYMDYGCRHRRQTLHVLQNHLGLPFASCPGWETIKAAAVLLAAVVAAEYKTNDHFVAYAAAHKFTMAVPTRSPEVNLKSRISAYTTYYKLQIAIASVLFPQIPLLATFQKRKRNQYIRTFDTVQLYVVQA